MSERIVTDPSQHGWVEVNGKWMWGASGGSGGGSIQDGDTEGQITTWDGTEWTPEGAVVVSGGDVGIGGEPGSFGSNAPTLQFTGTDNSGSNQARAGAIKFISGNGAKETALYSSEGFVSFYTGDVGASYERMRIDADGAVGIGTSTPKGGNSKLTLLSQGSGAGANINFQNDHNSGFNFGISGDTNGDVVLWNEAATEIKFATSNAQRMSIGADGNVDVIDGDLSVKSTTNTAAINLNNSVGNYEINNNEFGSIAINYNGAEKFVLASNGDVYISGKLYVSGVEVADGMVKAFSKLRDAVKDEDTVESLKESITNWIGGMIEEWESMQSPATQEISDE